MKNVRDTWCIQIEVTNKCEKRCANCHHLIQYVEPWEMDLETFKMAIDSLEGWPKVVGIIGGNPVFHTRFEEITSYFKQKFPRKEQRGMWISHYGKYEKLIKEEYGYINYNPHNEPVSHQPVLCASKDIIKDETIRKQLIDACWVADIWSPSITPKGCYRCEVHGTMDMALNYNLGLPMVPGWWKAPLSAFQAQIDAFCEKCSMCIPMVGRNDKDPVDDITKSNFAAFKHCPRIMRGEYNLVDPNQILLENQSISEWQPHKYILSMRRKK